MTKYITWSLASHIDYNGRCSAHMAHTVKDRRVLPETAHVSALLHNPLWNMQKSDSRGIVLRQWHNSNIFFSPQTEQGTTNAQK